MDVSQITTTQWLLVGVGIGFGLGLIPLIVGIVKGKTKMGLIGFAATLAGGTLLGLIVALPAAAIFTWLIVRNPKRAEPSE